MLRFIAVIILVLPHVNCAAAMALPPTRTDVGSMVVNQDGKLANGSRVSSGMHWASGTRSRTVPFDIGAGVVYEHHAMPGEATASGVTAKSVEPPRARQEHAMGGYVEAASRLSASGITRSWIGGRGEILRTLDGRQTSMGASVRLSWEVYAGGTSAGAEGGSKGFVIYAAGGTVGIGTYLEAGARRLSNTHNEFLVTGGVSVRLPAIAFLGVASR